jgi:hypothetical protein
MEKTITLPLDEYLDLKRIKEETLNPDKKIVLKGNYGSVYLFTKDEAIVNMLDMYNRLSEKWYKYNDLLNMSNRQYRQYKRREKKSRIF